MWVSLQYSEKSGFEEETERGKIIEPRKIKGRIFTFLFCFILFLE